MFIYLYILLNIISYINILWTVVYISYIVIYKDIYTMDIQIYVSLTQWTGIWANLERQWRIRKLQFSSVAQSCLTLRDPMDCSTPGLPVHHQLLEFTQTHVHWVSDANQPSPPLSPPSPPALNLSQHQGLFKWVSSWHQVAKVLEFQLQHQSFQWTPRTDLL